MTGLAQLKALAVAALDALDSLDDPHDLGLELTLRGKSSPDLSGLQAVAEYWGAAGPSVVLRLISKLELLEAAVESKRFSGGQAVAPQDGGRIMRLKAVKAAVGFGTTHIYNLMNAGKFPRSRSIGLRAVGWDAREVDQWISDRLHRLP